MPHSVPVPPPSSQTHTLDDGLITPAAFRPKHRARSAGGTRHVCHFTWFESPWSTDYESCLKVAAILSGLRAHDPKGDGAIWFRGYTIDTLPGLCDRINKLMSQLNS